MTLTAETQESTSSCSDQPKCNQKSSGIPLSRKVCYGIGGMPYQMTDSARSFFIQIFLLDVVQMMPFYVSIILFLVRAWDAITDPLVGFAVSKSGCTRYGKLIPWIMLSMPAGVISYIMLWYTSQDSTSPSLGFWWYFIWCCLLDTFLSCYHVPYSSLNMFLGGNEKDRDSATSYRMGMEVLATLAGATIQGQIVGAHHTKKTQTCTILNENRTLATNYTTVLNNQSDSYPDQLQQMRRAYLTAALVIGAFYFLCCIVLFFGVKEQLAPLSKLDRFRMSYSSGMKLVVGHRPYVQLVLGFFFSSVAFQMAQGNFALFCIYAAGMQAYFQHIVIILLVAATLSIPLWQMLLVRLGKKTTITIGLASYIPALVIVSTVKGNVPVFFGSSILAGASVASLYLLPWSMLPDAIDDFKVKNRSYTDLEPMFYSCYAFCNKFGGGVSHGISTLALHFAGYKPGACRQDSRVITTLQMLFAPVPISLLLIGLVIFCFYPINEQRRQQIQASLQQAEAENKQITEEETCLRSLSQTNAQ